MCEHHDVDETGLKRRTLLKSMGAASLLGVFGSSLLVEEASAAAKKAGVSGAVVMTEAQRAAMSPDDIIAMMKSGNERFLKGKSHAHNYLAEQRKVSAGGQFPAALILSCIDSRAPAETIMDLGVGDIFNARIAGNISNDDLLGSMEFACKVAGAKVILVMGHTKCGAIAGAIAKVELGHLTGLLDKIKPAVDAANYQGERSAKNYAFVDAVAKKNVELTIAEIQSRSTILGELVTAGTLKIVGAMYDIDSGIVNFI